MTYFELSCFLCGILAPIVVAIGYGIVYTIKDKKDKEEK